MTKLETDSKGIPIKGPYPDQPPVLVMYSAMTTIFSCIMGTVAFYAIVKDNAAADAKISLLAQYDLGYLYAALIVLRVGQFLMGVNAGHARKYCKVHPPDQHVYEVKGAEGSKLGYVLMDQEGVNGKFNRAQRAVVNYNETFPQTALYIVAGGFVFPKEMLVLVSIYSAARVMMAVGYASSVKGRMLGFMISNLTGSLLEVLVGIIAYKAMA